MTGDTPTAQQVLEAEAGKIIWAAASLVPGTPGHAGKTIKLIAAMQRLLREGQSAGAVEQEKQRVLAKYAPPEPTPDQPEFQQFEPPRSVTTTDPEDLKLLLARYAKPERRH